MLATECQWTPREFSDFTQFLSNQSRQEQEALRYKQQRYITLKQKATTMQTNANNSRSIWGPKPMWTRGKTMLMRNDNAKKDNADKDIVVKLL